MKRLKNTHLDNKAIQKFGHTIASQGYTQVPNLLLEYQKELKISNSELRLLLHILQHRWDNNPGKTHPALKKLIKFSGMSSATIHRAKDKLIEKGYLKTLKMLRNPYRTHSYDITGLLTALRVEFHRTMQKKLESGAISKKEYEGYLEDTKLEIEYEKSKSEFDVFQNESHGSSEMKHY